MMLIIHHRHRDWIATDDALAGTTRWLHEAYIYIYIHMYRERERDTYIHTYIHTYIYTCNICVYTHTCHVYSNIVYYDTI